MSTVRLRRLRADYEKLSEYLRRHPRLRLIQTEGDPPEKYQIEYQIKSLRMAHGELQPVQRHIVEIALPLNYPRTPPQCRMLSPVFHPNIAPHAICVGDHWGAGESLQSIVARIGEMLAYQSYNVKSPLNGEAARWVEENKHRLPLDGVSLLVEENGSVGGEGAAVAAAQTQVGTIATNGDSTSASSSAAQKAAPEASEGATTVQIVCPACGASYRMPAEFGNRKLRCRKCMHVFTTGAAPSAP
jgi:ubiquitin-protein ligase